MKLNSVRLLSVAVLFAVLSACNLPKEQTSETENFGGVRPSPTPQVPAGQLKATSPIEGKLVSVRQAAPDNCPPGAACSPTSKIKIKYTLAGCSDELGLAHYSIAEEGGKVKVYTTADNIHTFSSERARCAAMPEKSLDLQYRPGLDASKVVIEKLDTVMGYTNLPRGTVRLYDVEAKLVGVDADFGNCPPNALCQPRAKINLTFDLAGCVDDLVQVKYRLEEKANGKRELKVSGTAAFDQGSLRARCIAKPTKAVSIMGGAFFDRSDLEVTKLGLIK
jgi:hypothetical protein